MNARPPDRMPDRTAPRGIVARSPRGGWMARPVAAMAASLVALVALIASMRDSSESEGPPPDDEGGRGAAPNAERDADAPLLLYCAASNKGVIEAVCRDYEAEFGRSVQVQYGASQTLLSAAEVSGTGDLYLPADDSYLEIAREKGLIAEEFPLATMQVLVAVKKENPKGIARLEDLLRDNVRVAQANPDGAAVGKLTRDVLTASGHWDALRRKTTVFKTNVTEVANDVKIGSVDVGIVYDAVLHDYPDLEGVAIPELASAKARIAIGVLASSERPQQALHFARYVAARDRGLLRYREFGFRPVDGEAWSERSQAD